MQERAPRGPNFGPVHRLIVHQVGEPYGPFSTDDFSEYEVVHSPECQYRDGHYVCAVAFNIEQGGARYSLHYTGTPVTEPGEYAIQAWAETIRGFDYVEYDGGIGLIPHTTEDNHGQRSSHDPAQPAG